MRVLTWTVFAVCFSSSALIAKMDRYQQNRCEDRGVYITMLTGLALTVALVTPGGYILTPNQDFNQEPNCPTESPISCCDPKAQSQNATTPPNNCSLAIQKTCNAPKIPYCFGATVPADFRYQQWALQTGIPLVVFGGIGFFTAIGAAVTGCMIGTCCFG